MEMQYLAGCSVQWQPGDKARPVVAADAEDQSELAAGQSRDDMSIINASDPQARAQGE